MYQNENINMWTPVTVIVYLRIYDINSSFYLAFLLCTQTSQENVNVARNKPKAKI